MFKSLKIKNFRGVENLELQDLNQINIFVGENGVGKTTLLDAVFIGINPNNAELAFRTNMFRGLGNVIDEDFWRSYFYNLDSKNIIQIELDGQYNRKIKISPNFYTQETISLNKEDEKNKIGSMATAMSELKRLVGLDINFSKINEKQEIKYQAKIFQDNKGIHWDGDKSYQELLSGNYMNNRTVSENVNLFSKFAEISTANKEGIVLKMLQSLEPNIQDIESHTIKGIVIKDKRFSRKVSINIYGDGVLRCMHLICNVLEHDSGVTLIDEIENGLHIKSREIVWNTIFNLLQQKENRQIFATTHSYEIVESLFKVAKNVNKEDSISLLRIQKDRNGKTIIVKYSKEELEYALQNKDEIR
ncbi:MAG: AAA family ATPase [Patescibacteria group bacterium]